jgi:hypothetical protein
LEKGTGTGIMGIMEEWKRIVAGYRLEVRGQTQNEKCKVKSAKCKMD